MIKKYIGDKGFYKMVLAIAVPIMIQEGFTNFVNLLDNLMVGRVGTDQMSAVAIVNQLLFVFNLTLFGALSGAGIFVSQYHGGANYSGEKKIFKIKIGIGFSIIAIGIITLTLFPEKLISLFLNEGGNTGDPVATMKYAKEYLAVMLIGLPAYGLTQCFSSTLRETELTSVPMKAGITAVLTNLVLNYLLIYGKLGFPILGVKGAAIATSISRYIELLFVATYALTHKDKCRFINREVKGALSGKLIVNVLLKALPLMFNELFWSGGMTVINQCYSTRGLAVVAAVNIATTVSTLFSIVFSAMGSSISIVVGNQLGADDMERAKDTDNKMMAFSVIAAAITAMFLVGISGVFPLLYNTTDEVRHLASKFIIVIACCMPMESFNHACYFTLRSGGKTFITALYDSCYMWLCPVLIGFVLSRYTAMPILQMYIICSGLNIIKCAIGFAFIKSNMWMNNIVKKF